jgi:hypothetical protein
LQTPHPVAQPSQPFAVEMRVLCAWCCREGQPGYLGEREPLDNPLPTRGICERHKVEFLQSLPSRSYPGVELVIVVHRDHAELFEPFSRYFAGNPSVKVILDRRVGERRAGRSREPRDRRSVKKRRVREGTVSPFGDFTIVRFTPKRPIVPELVEVVH